MADITPLLVWKIVEQFAISVLDIPPDGSGCLCLPAAEDSGSRSGSVETYDPLSEYWRSDCKQGWRPMAASMLTGPYDHVKAQQEAGVVEDVLPIAVLEGVSGVPELLHGRRPELCMAMELKCD